MKNTSRATPRREEEALRLLGEWLKKEEAHAPASKEFKGGYQPFLARATSDFIAACNRNEPEWP